MVDNFSKKPQHQFLALPQSKVQNTQVKILGASSSLQGEKIMSAHTTSVGSLTHTDMFPKTYYTSI